MTIQQHITNCINDTMLIRQKYPSVTNVRYEIFDIPLEELRRYAAINKCTLHTNNDIKRAYIIISPLATGTKMDSDIWMYSTIVKIKPAEIISE